MCKWGSQGFFGRVSVMAVEYLLLKNWLLQDDVGVPDDRPPLGVLFCDVIGELMRRAAERRHPDFGELFSAGVAPQKFVHALVDLVDDVGRRSCRREQRGPAVGFET